MAGVGVGVGVRGLGQQIVDGVMMDPSRRRPSDPKEDRDTFLRFSIGRFLSLYVCGVGGECGTNG